MWVLLEQPRVIFQNRSNVRCPLCRHVTMVEDISYVSTVRQLTDEDKHINVKVCFMMFLNWQYVYTGLL